MANPKVGLKHVWVIVLFLSVMVSFPVEALATGWTIQVRSCLTQPEANGVKKNLEAYGLKPEVSFEHAGDKGMRYRVMVGHFDGRNAAEIYAQELKSSGIVKEYWIKPDTRGSQAVGASSDQPQPMPANEHIGGGSIDDHGVVYPPMPNQVAMNGPVYQTNPAMGGPCQPGAVGCSAPVMAPPLMTAPPVPVPAYQPGVPCTGTAYPAANQVVLDDQPPMKGCQTSPNLYYYPTCGETERRGMYIGARAGIMVWPEAKDFSIVRTRNGIATIWQEDYTVVPHISLLAGYRFNNYFALEGALDLPYTYEWKSWFLSFSPKLMYPVPGTNMTPYFKGGPVIGSFTWADAPNEFDDALGWEIGAGVDIEIEKNLAMEIGATYRHIVFEYNEPINTVTPNGDLDLSGYTVDIGFRYRF